MADNWDDDDDAGDDWDVSDDDLDKRLNNLGAATTTAPQFNDEEEDLAVKERALAEKAKSQELRLRGNVLAEKKAAEQARIEEEEIARKAVELEAEAEANMSPEERRVHQQRRVEEADNALTADLFGNTGNINADKAVTTAAAGDSFILKDIKDHLKHARKTATALREHGKIHLVAAFFKECLAQSSAVLDDDAVSELIKQLNVLKNEKTQAAKRKVKGQANKAKKADKESIEKARKMVETFGDNDKFDQYDTLGEDFEDSFF
jgi:translation initiation factor 3 subunit J